MVFRILHTSYATAYQEIFSFRFSVLFADHFLYEERYRKTTPGEIVC